MDRQRALEEKPAKAATSGLLLRQVAESRIASGAANGSVFDDTFTKFFKDALQMLSWGIAQDEVKDFNWSYQVSSPTSLAGALKADADLAKAKTGTIDLPTAIDLVRRRRILKVELPLKSQALAVLKPYINSHRTAKRDIWAARDVTLTEADKITPVRIGIWDTGVDTALYSSQLYVDPRPGHHSPHGLAFDTHGELYAGDLQPLTPDQRAAYPGVLSFLQGMNDLQESIDSPAASAAADKMATTPPDQLAAFRRTVLLDANGYEAESYVPGGTVLRESGISMASPNVVNLAAKLIALDPKLTPEQTIARMRQGATPSADGRLHIINPKATVALLASSH